MLGGVSIAVGSWGYCAGPEGIAAMTGEEFEASATCVAGTIAGAGTAGVGALLMTVGALFNF
jgi:hypothetical protein